MGPGDTVPAAATVRSNESDWPIRPDEIYQALRPYALQLAGGNRDQAEELVQETLLRATENVQRLWGIDHPLAWLRTVLYHIFVDQKREAASLICTHDDIATLDANTDEYTSLGTLGLSREVDQIFDEVALSSDEMSFLAAVALEEKRSEATRKRVARLGPRLKAHRLLHALSGGTTRKELLLIVEHAIPHLRGGPAELILARADDVRADPVVQRLFTQSLDFLLRHSFETLRAYVREPQNTSAAMFFRKAYCLQRLAVLLAPEMYLASLSDWAGVLMGYRRELPLVERLFNRMHALTGEPVAIEQQRNYWLYCLSDVVPTRDARFAASYVAMYFSGPNTGRQLLEAFHHGDESRVKEILRSNDQAIRGELISEAYRNLAEIWYRNPLWAESNFLRMHLALGFVGKYAGLTPKQSAQAYDVARHALLLSRTPIVRSRANGVMRALKA